MSDMAEDLIDLDVGIDEVDELADFGEDDIDPFSDDPTLDGEGQLLLPVVSRDQQDGDEMEKEEARFLRDPDALIISEALAKRRDVKADERRNLLRPSSNERFSSDNHEEFLARKEIEEGQGGEK